MPALLAGGLLLGFRGEPPLASSYPSGAGKLSSQSRNEAPPEARPSSRSIGSREEPLQQSAQALFDQALKDIQQARYEQAIEPLRRALELDPHNEDFVLELSEVFVAHNNAPAAVTLFEAATKVFPISPRIWYGLGVAYLAEVHYSSAEAALRKSLELDPALDLAYVVLGQGYQEAGKWEQLQETARLLIALSPKNSMGYYYQALAMLRNPASVATSDAEIKTILRKSVELGGNLPEPHYEFAKLLATKGKKEDAQGEFEKLTRTNPDFGPAHYQLYRLYREKGQFEKSEEEKQVHEKISAEERKKAMTGLLVEVHQRTAK